MIMKAEQPQGLQLAGGDPGELIQFQSKSKGLTPRCADGGSSNPKTQEEPVRVWRLEKNSLWRQAVGIPFYL